MDCHGLLPVSLRYSGPLPPALHYYTDENMIFHGSRVFVIFAEEGPIY